MLKILDLFCGIGGTALGVHRLMLEREIEYKYDAVDNDSDVLRVHKINNPGSNTLNGDAWEFLVRNYRRYDIIWASPPCQTHSRLNYIYKKPIDHTLWKVIEFLRRKYKGLWIVENVMPGYKPPIMYNIRVGRHVFWSDVDLSEFDYVRSPKKFIMMGISDLAKYHSLIVPSIEFGKKRQMLRNAVHWSISYGLVKQLLDVYYFT